MTLTFDTHVASFSSMHLLNFEIIGGNSYRKKMIIFTFYSIKTSVTKSDLGVKSVKINPGS